MIPLTRQAPRRAFTLIELLVVIAIISLLVSILLPSLQRAKILARTAMCAANMRNFGLSTALYASDWDYNAPPHWQQGPGIPSSEQRYFRILHNREYLEEDQAFVCPENGTPQPGSTNETLIQWYTPGPEPNDNLLGLHSGGYTSNQELLGFWDRTEWLWKTTTSGPLNHRVEPPGPFGSVNGWLLLDAGYGNINTDTGKLRLANHQTNDKGRISHTGVLSYPEHYHSLRHGTRFNVLAVDSHVEAMTLSEATGNAPDSQNASDTSGYDPLFDYMAWR